MFKESGKIGLLEKRPPRKMTSLKFVCVCVGGGGGGGGNWPPSSLLMIMEK